MTATPAMSMPPPMIPTALSGPTLSRATQLTAVTIESNRTVGAPLYVPAGVAQIQRRSATNTPTRA
jgi:hypothetical protein